MPLPRMTTRRWMLVVAAAGLALGALRYRPRWETCRDLAKLDATREQRLRALLASGQESFYERDGTPHSTRKWINYCVQRRAQWERAAYRPWLPMPPDLPWPD